MQIVLTPTEGTFRRSCLYQSGGSTYNVAFLECGVGLVSSGVIYPDSYWPGASKCDSKLTQTLLGVDGARVRDYDL